MTRENKLVMVIGFGFLLFLGILVSDHLAANTTPLKQELVSYKPDPKALPGETERFGTRALPESEPLPPVDSSDIGIAIGGFENGLQGTGMQGIGAPGVIDAAALGAPSRPAGERVHKVAKGDNPESIAKKHYGKRSLGAKLAEFNGIKPTDLKIGQELRIPDISVLDPKAAPQETAPPVGGTIAVVPEATVPGAPQAETGPRIATHRVRDGDTLYRIAREVYGDSTRWPEIASLNGLGKNPKLRPGMELKYALAD
ncbi:MAG: LysM peptidoglycan-binding domain-containing protein [Planctomycetaceae bacterium]|nr:LysM peptidoglycan-binding domain-containing protein [Planctomycetaceae bacterium]